jgi:DNA-binding transcriptional ArsR family regulator
MLSYLVTSKVRRRLLELLWLHEATGSASELARRARVGFSTAYRELKAMESFGLVAVRGEGGREVYAAASEHPDANLLRQLVASKPSAAAPRDQAAEGVRRRARALGAPLPVVPEPVPDAEREQVVVDAVRLARRDATFARVMPVMLWTQRDMLDRERLLAAALRAHEKHALGFLVALTAEIAGDPELRAWSERLRDHRARGTRPFFALASSRATHPLAARRTPQVARDWGFSMDLDLESFRTAFDKHMAVAEA